MGSVVNSLIKKNNKSFNLGHFVLWVCMCLGVVSCSNNAELQRLIPLSPLQSGMNQKKIANTIVKAITENEKIAEFLAKTIEEDSNLKNIGVFPRRSGGSERYNIRITFGVLNRNDPKTNKGLENIVEIVGEMINRYFVESGDYDYSDINEASREFVVRSFLGGKKGGYDLVPKELREKLSKDDYIRSIEQSHKDGYPNDVLMVGTKMLPHAREFYSFAFGRDGKTPFIYLLRIHYYSETGYRVVGFERISASKFEKFVSGIKFINREEGRHYFAGYNE